MHIRHAILIGGLAILASGCYHATIETGAPPSPEVVDKEMMSGWVLGLVPPKTVNTAAECKNGVSKVETQQTFVDGLIRVITLGIYTPMSVKVTCAAKPGAAAPSGG
jgi:hypothetical protein